MIISGTQWSDKNGYLGVCLLIFLGTVVTAHMAGSRNVRQFIGVLCGATEALFDEAFTYSTSWSGFAPVPSLP